MSLSRIPDLRARQIDAFIESNRKNPDMAEVVDRMPDSDLDARRKYDWETYMDGRCWCLERGVDFRPDLQPSAVRQAARQYATRNSIELRTAVRGDKVFLQAMKPDDDT